MMDNEQKSNLDIHRTKPILDLVNGELSTKRRWIYRLCLLAAAIMMSLVVSLWTTEPEPMPLRLHIAFGVMCVIAAVWIAVLGWILTRVQCPTALDRVATCWAATVACSLSLVVSLAISISRGEFSASVWLGIIGATLLATALVMLRSAYRIRDGLKAKLEQMRHSKSVGSVGLLLVFCWSFVSSAVADDSLVLKQIRIGKGGNSLSAEMGMLTVPMSRAGNSDRDIEIAFVRVKGVDPDAAPTFVLAGGPGDSGIRVVKGMFGAGPDRIQRIIKGDVIGIDQRGTGESEPSLKSDRKFGLPLEDRGDPEAWLRKITSACQDVAAEMRKRGIDLDSFNTRENAHDVEAIRVALGYQQINLWGTSYGSHLGMTFLREFPQSANRAMFHSPEGPDHTQKHPEHVQKALERISKATGGKLVELMRTVHQRLEKEPVVVPVKDPRSGKTFDVGISSFDIKLLAWSALGKIETTKQLAKLYVAMDRGDFSFPARWLIQYRKSASVQSAMKHVMDATSGCSLERAEQILEHSNSCELSDVINFPGDQMAKIWGVTELDEGFRSPKSCSTPVLFIVGELDPRTPIENVDELVKHFPNTEVYVAKGAGHGFVPNPKVLKRIAHFFGK